MTPDGDPGPHDTKEPHMDPLSAALVGGIIIGLIVGIPTGRVWAEVSRARADMKRTWESRSAYRKGKK